MGKELFELHGVAQKTIYTALYICKVLFPFAVVVPVVDLMYIIVPHRVSVSTYVELCHSHPINSNI